jgi:hypothetical protein
MSFARVAYVLIDLLHSTAISYALAPRLPHAIFFSFFGHGMQFTV